MNSRSGWTKHTHAPVDHVINPERKVCLQKVRRLVVLLVDTDRSSSKSTDLVGGGLRQSKNHRGRSVVLTQASRWEDVIESSLRRCANAPGIPMTRPRAAETSSAPDKERQPTRAIEHRGVRLLTHAVAGRSNRCSSGARDHWTRRRDPGRPLVDRGARAPHRSYANDERKVTAND